ncbi:hypothetical protein V2W23_14325, partial [Staphylococcus gallinarum]|uniref:hypothetical protein n=1 Tax=Staphylococcus gallinarum TaxID=1293 RepID=UPI0031802C0E
MGHPFTTDQPLTQLSNAFTITTNPSSAFNYNPTAAPGSALQGITDINANNWQLNKCILALVRGKGNQGINFDYT